MTNTSPSQYMGNGISAFRRFVCKPSDKSLKKEKK